MTPLLGPGWGNYAIRGIVEIDLPDPVSWQPQTLGWLLLVVALCALVARGLQLRWQRYRRNRYRREALTRLDELEQRYLGGDKAALRGLAPLLRATALQAGDRATLASAQGEAWERALAQMAPNLPPLPVRTLAALAYQPLPEAPGTAQTSLFRSLREWIARHEPQHA